MMVQPQEKIIAEIPEGICQCGCGSPTGIYKNHRRREGKVKGQHKRVLHGHRAGMHGSKHPAWKGGKSKTAGYIKVHYPDHPNATKAGYVVEHNLVAEKALGHILPPSAVVHHVNEDKADNRNDNLVICQDRAYHNLLHRRMRALTACGHPDWMICLDCGQYDAPENMQVRGFKKRHKPCPGRQAIRKAKGWK